MKTLRFALTMVVLVTMKCSFVVMELELFYFLGVRRNGLRSEVNVKSVRHKMEIRFAVTCLRNSLSYVSSGLFQNTVLFTLN